MFMTLVNKALKEPGLFGERQGTLGRMPTVLPLLHPLHGY